MSYWRLLVVVSVLLGGIACAGGALKPSTAVTSVTVTVKDQAGLPLAGVDVSYSYIPEDLSKSQLMSVSTDHNGVATLPTPAGLCYFSVFPPNGYVAGPNGSASWVDMTHQSSAAVTFTLIRQ